MVFLTNIFILVYMYVNLVTVRDFVDKLKRSFSWEKSPVKKKKSP